MVALTLCLGCPIAWSSLPAPAKSPQKHQQPPKKETSKTEPNKKTKPKKPPLPVDFSTAGISGDVKTNVDAALTNLSDEIQIPIMAGQLKHVYRKAPNAIRKAMQPFGYFKTHIQSTLKNVGGKWHMDFVIQPGPQIEVTHVHIKITGAGQDDHAFARLLKHMPLEAGKPFLLSHFNTARQRLFVLASKRGYFKNKMKKSKIVVNLLNYTVQIYIVFNTGPRYRFGDTTFSKAPFKPSFLNRFLSYHAGQYYNEGKLEETQSYFNNSNYFEQVVVTPHPKKATHGEVPIHIQLLPKKAWQYTFGAGFGTDTGPRGMIGITGRRLNDSGHRMNALIQGSQKNSQATINYQIPGPNPATDIFTMSAGVGNQNQVTGNSNSAKAAMSYATSGKHWQQIYSLIYLNERYNITSSTLNIPYISTTLLFPEVQVNYLKTNHPVSPSSGFRLNTLLAGTFGHPSSDISKTSFNQVRISFKTLSTLRATHTRFLFRGSLGRTDIPQISELPLSLQLFAGGANSIRGYSFNSIGPGRNKYTASAEIQQRVIGDFYLAAFMDVGNVGNNDVFKHMNIGVGPGIVWLSPLGAFELTLGNAISQPNKPWMIQFSMGPQI